METQRNEKKKGFTACERWVLKIAVQEKKKDVEFLLFSFLSLCNFIKIQNCALAPSLSPTDMTEISCACLRHATSRLCSKRMEERSTLF